MALSITLVNSDLTLNLHDGSVYGIRLGGLKLGQPTRNRVFSQPWGLGHAPLAGETVYNRECVIDLDIHGTSLDNWTANYRNLALVCRATTEYWKSRGARGKPGTLVVKLDGQTNATTFDILAGEIDASDIGQPAMTVTGSPWLSTSRLLLTLKPFGRAASLTNTTSPTLTNGGGTSGGGTTAMSYLLEPVGDQTAPMRLTIQGAVFISRSQRYIFGRRSRPNASNVQTAFRTETSSTNAGETTYPGYTVRVPGISGFNRTRVFDSSMTNTTFLRFFPAPGPWEGVLLSIGIDSASDYIGSYRVFVRFRDTSRTATNMAVSIGFGGDSATWEASNAPTALRAGVMTLPTIYDLGVITIPVHSQEASRVGTFWMHLLARAEDGTSNQSVGLDHIYMIPCDEQFIDARLSEAAAAGDRIEFSDLGPVIAHQVVTSASNPTNKRVLPFQRTALTVEPPNKNLWAGLVFSTHNTTQGAILGHQLTELYTLGFDYYPTYDQFVS